MLAVGLMSGTSLDGIDAALCEVNRSNHSTQVKLLAYQSYAIPDSLKDQIKLACLDQAATRQICSLNFEFGSHLAKAVQAICHEAQIESESLDFVASHGQTIYHLPEPSKDEWASTLQIGEPAVIAAECGCPVVANFRVMDMAVGGQGAPLVPFSEWLLYSSPKQNRILQNIGGIGNLTYLPKAGKLDDLVAFDTGPGNMMIDYAMQTLFNRPYDDEGKMGARGQLIEPLYAELIAHPYLRQALPKTTGREMFGNHVTQELIDRYGQDKPEDIVHTLTRFTTYSIAEAYRYYLLPKCPIDQVIVGGGGAYNPTLMKMLEEELAEEKIEVLQQENLGYSSDAKEAIAFAVLGYETMHHRPSNAPSATGAKRPVVLGSITRV